MAQLKDTTITGGLSVSGTTNITGATQHSADVTLYSSSGDSPSIIFQRGTYADNLNDYKITDVGGYLKIKQQGNSSTSGFTQVAELTNQGTFTVSTPPTSDTSPSVTAWISPTDSAIKISTDATIASGDKLVIRDSSDSNKLRSSSITFGTSTTTYLRNDGTWGTPSGSGGGGVTPSDIVVKGYDETGETTLYTGNLGSGLAVIEPLILDSSAVSELAIEHKNSGVTAGEYVSSLSGKNTIFYIPKFSVDSAGHITTATNITGAIQVLPTASQGVNPAAGLVSNVDFVDIANNNNFRDSHKLIPQDSSSVYGDFTFYPYQYASAGYYSVDLKFLASDIFIGYSGYGNTITAPSSYRIESITFLEYGSKTPPGSSSSVYGYWPVDFDWFCTAFTYNSTSTKYEATLYIYVDSSLTSAKNIVYMSPKIVGVKPSTM